MGEFIDFSRICGDSKHSANLCWGQNQTGWCYKPVVQRRLDYWYNGSVVINIDQCHTIPYLDTDCLLVHPAKEKCWQKYSVGTVIVQGADIHWAREVNNIDAGVTQ